MTRAGLLAFTLGCFACAADGDDTTAASDVTSPATEDGGSEGAGPTTSPATNADDGDGSTQDTADDANDESDEPTTGDTAATDDGAPTSGTDESTGGPTSGPGVLPGESGLEAFCRRYVECGGTYYADEQACIDASYDYWGECATRAEALDVFGACMADMACDDWSPDAYNPASTPCAEQWSDLGASEAC